MQQAMKQVGLPEQISELRQHKAGDERKALVAHPLRESTAMSSRWIAQRLEMGHTSGVSRIADQVPQNAKQREGYDKLTNMFNSMADPIPKSHTALNSRPIHSFHIRRIPR